MSSLTADPSDAIACVPGVPKIHAISGVPQRLALSGRVTALLIALCCLAPLAVGAWLTPDPAGSGSHTRLGLASCRMMDVANFPCPSCGMTTSFTWFARGNVLASFYVQPMGMLLALAAAVVFWAGLYIAITGKPLHRLLRPVPGYLWVVVPFTLAVLAWGWKIFIHMRGVDGWQ